MRAAVYHGPQDVRVEHVPDAPAPGRGEVLLDVVRASICGTDVAEYFSGPHLVPLRRRHPVSGHEGPMVLGHEILGRVLAVGEDVHGLQVGARVVPGAGIWCGECPFCLAGRPNLCATYYTVGIHRDGGLAEAVTVPAAMCMPVPDAVADDHAVMAQPLAVALHAVGRGQVRAGDAVAVIGVGGIGGMVVSALRPSGASPLIAVDVSGERLAAAARVGASDLVDATAQDAVRALREATGGEGAHVVFEASGSEQGLRTALASVRRGGRVVLIGIQVQPRAIDLSRLLLDEIDLVTTMAHVCHVDIPAAVDLLADAELANAMLDRVVDLEDVVEAGFVALADGTAQGKVVVRTRSG